MTLLTQYSGIARYVLNNAVKASSVAAGSTVLLDDGTYVQSNGAIWLTYVPPPAGLVLATD